MGFPSEELVKWINSYCITCCLLDKNSLPAREINWHCLPAGPTLGQLGKDFSALPKFQTLLSLTSSEEPFLILGYDGFFRDSDLFTETCTGALPSQAAPQEFEIPGWKRLVKTSHLSFLGPVPTADPVDHKLQSPVLSDTQKQRRHDNLAPFSEENTEMDVPKMWFLTLIWF